MLEFDNAGIVFKEAIVDYDEPSVGAGDYYGRFEEIIRRYDRADMFALLSEAVEAPMYKAYEAVETFCINVLNEK
jgi:hypothetical protein